MRCKVVTTSMLQELVQKAMADKRNAVPRKAAVDGLDPEGVHVVSFEMVHNDVEMRLVLYVKLLGQDEPSMMTLDVSFDDYNRLPVYDTEMEELIS